MLLCIEAGSGQSLLGDSKPPVPNVAEELSNLASQTAEHNRAFLLAPTFCQEAQTQQFMLLLFQILKSQNVQEKINSQDACHTSSLYAKAFLQNVMRFF